MLPKNELKYIQSLSQKKSRTESGQFVAEGPKLIAELLNRKPAWVRNIYATEEWWNHQTQQARNKHQRQFTAVQPFELEKMSNLQTPQEVLAVLEIPKTQFHHAANASATKNWLLVLDGIQDPGNMGTIIRTAHWFGIGQIICSPDCADVYQPKTVQATMGSIFGVEIFYENLEDFFGQNQLPVYGALLKGAPVDRIDPETKGIIIIGNEGRGIRPELIPFINHPVTIPGIGDAESLNAGIAAGIMLYSFTKK
ncbi:MAG: RNA methyltransferase [Chitinophagaceae bacterium]